MKELSLVRHTATMKLILLSVFFISAVYSQNNSAARSSSLKKEHFIKINKEYLSEIDCLKKLDSILKKRWSAELNKIPTIDLGNLGKIWWEVKDSSYAKYNTFEEEWLMNDALPAGRIEQCFRKLIPDAVPYMNQNEIQCLNKLFSTHIVREIDHQDEYESVLKKTSREQLPFRKFISFIELVDVMFQNRNPDTMTDLERVLYEHAESYLITEEDRSRKTYVQSLDCDWVNAKTLREISDEERKFKEFVSQVYRAVDKQLASNLLRKWNLNAHVSVERYESWQRARQNMVLKVNKEVEKLRKQRKDGQWLCEHATKIGLEFSKEQLDILLTDDKSSVHLGISDVASKARAIEKTLEKLNDFRYPAIKIITDKYEEGTRCLFAGLHLLENHRKHDIVTAFIDETYSYPEMFCGGRNKVFGLVQVSFCNCVGTFCIAHPLAALFADEYVIVKGSDGIYQIVRSGQKSKRKIIHCHILTNGNKIR